MIYVPYDAAKLWWDKAGYTAYDEQDEIHRVLLQPNMVNDEFEPDVMIEAPNVIFVGGGEQAGKELHVDTPIATIDGWKTMGELRVGDLVFDEQGQPTLVEWVSGIRTLPAFRLSFDNGDNIIASGTHPWVVRNYSARKHGFSAKTRTTQELIDGGLIRLAPNNHRPFANWSIASPKPLICPEQVLPIDPYVLGAWLGDGHTQGARLTCADEPILAEIRSRGTEVRAQGDHYAYRLGSGDVHYRTEIGSMLGQMGLTKHKHIPPEYLRASYQQRIDLLRGLMDTDGYVDKRGRLSFCNTNADLIANFTELITTFGWSLRVQEKTAKLYGKDCGLVWNVSFQTTERVFNLPRKAERQRPEKHSSRSENIYITNIEPVGKQAVRCIGVSADSHLYLAGRGMIPTHNSTVAGNHPIARWMVDDLVWLAGNRYEDCEAEYRYAVNAAVAAGVAKKYDTSKDGPWTLEYLNGHIIETIGTEDLTKIARKAPAGVIMCEPGRQTEGAFEYLFRRCAPKTAWMLIPGTYEDNNDSWHADLSRAAMGANAYNARFFTLPSWSNRSLYPGGINDPKLRAVFRSIRESDPINGQQQIDERFGGYPKKLKGLVFDSYREATHTSRHAEFDPTREVYLWIDPGYNPSAYCVLFVQVVDDQVRIFDEIYVNLLVDTQVISLVKNHPAFPNVAGVVIDVVTMSHQGAQKPAVETWISAMAEGGRFIPVNGQYVLVADGISRTRDKLMLNPLTGAPYLIVHPRCLPAETIVEAVGIKGVSKRWYSGEMITIETKSGNKLSATPNHPILTDKGWVAIGLLKPGMHVMSRPNIQREEIIGPDHTDMPSRIGEIVEAFLEASEGTTIPVEVAPEDFHGDGAGSEVAIIGTNRLLGISLEEAYLNEKMSKSKLSTSDMALPQLVSGSRLHSLLKRDSFTKICQPSSSSLTPPSLRTPVREREFSRLALCSESDISLCQSPQDRTSCNPQLPSDFNISVSPKILSHDVFGIQISTPPMRNAQIVKPGKDSANVNTEFFRQRRTTPTDAYLSDEIISVNSASFSGHVYNLETEDHTYIAGNIVTHNCKNTIWEFTKGYKRHVRNDGSIVSGDPIDANNHAMKAIAYGIVHHFGWTDFRKELPKSTVVTHSYDKVFRLQGRRR